MHRGEIVRPEAAGKGMHRLKPLDEVMLVKGKRFRLIRGKE